MARNDTYIDDDFFLPPKRETAAVNETKAQTAKPVQTAPANKKTVQKKTDPKKPTEQKTAKKRQLYSTVALEPRTRKPGKRVEQTEARSPYQAFSEKELFQGVEYNYMIGDIRMTTAVTPLEDEFIKSAAFFQTGIEGKSDLVRYALRLYMQSVFKDKQLLEMIQSDLLRKGIIAERED